MLCIDIALLFQTDVCFDLILTGWPIKLLLIQPAASTLFPSVEIYSQLILGLQTLKFQIWPLGLDQEEK